VGTIGAINIDGLDLRSAVKLTGPLPRIFSTVKHDEVSGLKVEASEFQIDEVRLRPDGDAKDILAVLFIEVQVNSLGSHGVLGVGSRSLEPAELRTDLPHPLSTKVHSGGVEGVVLQEIAAVSSWVSGVDEVNTGGKKLVPVRVAGQVGAEGSSGAVLDGFNKHISNEPQQFFSAELLSIISELSLESLLNIRRSIIQLTFIISSQVLDDLGALRAASIGGNKDLIIEIREVQDSVNDGTGSPSTDSQMGILVSEPSRQSTGIAASNGDPFIVGKTISSLNLEPLNEISKIFQSLFDGEVSEVGGLQITERLTQTIESML